MKKGVERLPKTLSHPCDTLIDVHVLGALDWVRASGLGVLQGRRAFQNQSLS